MNCVPIGDRAEARRDERLAALAGGDGTFRRNRRRGIVARKEISQRSDVAIVPVGIRGPDGQLLFFAGAVEHAVLRINLQPG